VLYLAQEKHFFEVKIYSVLFLLYNELFSTRFQEGFDQKTALMCLEIRNFIYLNTGIHLTGTEIKSHTEGMSVS
jgi:hypothetical protein